LLPPTQLGRAIEAAERLELFDLRSIDDVLARSNGHRGRGQLRRALAHHHDADVRSDLEARFLELCREAGLPLPATKVLVAGFLVDGVEGAPPRRRARWLRVPPHPAVFERDRRRDAILGVEGYRILRFTHLTVKRDPGYVVATLRSFLVGSRRLTPN
jgi:hypothetical protein